MIGAAEQANWTVLDAYALTRPLMALHNLGHGRPPLWDDLHFSAGIYQEISQYLLNMVCEAPPDDTDGQPMVAVVPRGKKKMVKKKRKIVVGQKKPAPPRPAS